MTTPIEIVVRALQNLSWGQLWAGMGACFTAAVTATWRVAKMIVRQDDMQNHVQKMATNDFPHMFHTLINMDKNIAKMSGGDSVDFTELDASKKK